MAHVSEQKTIAKNTIFLYIRMIVVMFVSLYTSRVVLDKLGIEDYGIYNIVGSVVISFAFIKNALQSSTQRFLSYSKGSKLESSSCVFSMSMNINLLIILVVFVLLETVGLCFFYNVINIPDDRIVAARIVYHFSAITFCINLVQVPYISLIVSNERMSVYAILSVAEVILKLLIAYVLSVANGIDKLILYGALMMSVSFICSLITWQYCRIQLKEDCKYRFNWDAGLFKEIFSFASWNLIGGVSSVANTEGPNFFMNYYLGVNVNAAMGVAKQVSNAVYGFSSNFQTAFNPQIVKSYASGDRQYLFDLIFRASKLSFFLILIIAAPLIICCHDIMSIWLKVVPNYSEIFCVLILIAQLVAAMSSPFWMAAHAIGNIRNYQLMLVGFNISIIPVSWFVLRNGIEPYIILVFQILINIALLFYRVYYLRKKNRIPC